MSMKLSYNQAQELIKLKKKIVVNDEPQRILEIDQNAPLNCRFELVAEDADCDYSFLWEITQSDKNKLKISLHFQENESKIGLVRIDYNGSHQNPLTTNDDVPEHFKRYAGYYFNNESHIHFRVDGYKTLVWALPIDQVDFEIKDINVNDLNQAFCKAIMAFASYVNITTEIRINPLFL